MGQTNKHVQPLTTSTRTRPIARATVPMARRLPTLNPDVGRLIAGWLIPHTSRPAVLSLVGFPAFPLMATAAPTAAPHPLPSLFWRGANLPMAPVALRELRTPGFAGPFPVHVALEGVR